MRVSVALSIVALAIIAVLCAKLDAAQANQQATLKLLKDQQATTRRWQAKFAFASAHVARDVDTVRVRVTRVKELRDTLNIRDTVQVKVYLDRADSAVKACLDLANSCALFRVTSDSLVNALSVEKEHWRQYAEREARRHQRQRWLTYGALLGGVAFGAWLRGQ